MNQFPCFESIRSGTLCATTPFSEFSRGRQLGGPPLARGRASSCASWTLRATHYPGTGRRTSSSWTSSPRPASGSSTSWHCESSSLTTNHHESIAEKVAPLPTGNSYSRSRISPKYKLDKLASRAYSYNSSSRPVFLPCWRSPHEKTLAFHHHLVMCLCPG